MDRSIKVFTKSVVYIGGLITLGLVLFRGLVPFLWAGGSDLLLIAAIIVALLSIPLLLWLMTKAIRNIIETK